MDKVNSTKMNSSITKEISKKVLCVEKEEFCSKMVEFMKEIWQRVNSKALESSPPKIMSMKEIGNKDEKTAKVSIFTKMVEYLKDSMKMI